MKNGVFFYIFLCSAARLLGELACTATRKVMSNMGSFRCIVCLKSVRCVTCLNGLESNERHGIQVDGMSERCKVCQSLEWPGTS